jgi:hypothetical protein
MLAQASTRRIAQIHASIMKSGWRQKRRGAGEMWSGLELLREFRMLLVQNMEKTALGALRHKNTGYGVKEGYAGDVGGRLGRVAGSSRL